MQINLVFESNTTLAPSGFTTALEFAAQQLDALITDNITFSIDVNWDSTGQILGEAGPENMQLYNYTQVVSALQAHADSPVAQTAADDLPSTDPTGGYGVYLSVAQAEALGLMSGTSLPDGSVTFGTGGTVLNFSTSDLAVAGEEDFIGVAEHELSHAMGRSGWGDGATTGLYSLMDLYRFSSPGTLENGANIATDSSPPAYFSVDDGQTSLAAFSTVSDYYDWSTTAVADSFDAFSDEGVANTLSVADDDLMKALGFDVAACFCPGTRIATPAGEVQVERLVVGDEVLTKEGARRIKWIGRSTYAGRFIAGNPLMLPVIFAPGALGEGVPARPLTVSPGHGVCIGDALVPAWRLVNGVSVTQATRVDEVSYLHIELDRHGLLLSEGCWSESYLNETPRSWFQNAADYFARYPGEDVPGPPCLPRVEEGIALQAVQHYINGRAGLEWRPEAMGPLRGAVEQMGQGICAGWAYCPEAPELPVTLLVMRGAEILARVVANRYRPDLRAAGYGNGCHGFVLALPEADPGNITLRRVMDGAVLPPVQAARAA